MEGQKNQTNSVMIHVCYFAEAAHKPSEPMLLHIEEQLGQLRDSLVKEGDADLLGREISFYFLKDEAPYFTCSVSFSEPLRALVDAAMQAIAAENTGHEIEELHFHYIQLSSALALMRARKGLATFVAEVQS